MREGSLLALIAILGPLSVASIGGASGIYAPLQHQTVDVLGWLTPQDFIELFAIARVAADRTLSRSQRHPSRPRSR